LTFYEAVTKDGPKEIGQVTSVAKQLKPLSQSNGSEKLI